MKREKRREEKSCGAAGVYNKSFLGGFLSDSVMPILSKQKVVRKLFDLQCTQE